MTNTTSQIHFPAPYLIYLGDETSEDNCKTGFGIAEWANHNCIGQLRSNADTVSIGLADMNIEQAVKAGANSLILGIAGVGGQIPPSWHCDLIQAATLGMTIVSGAHERLAQLPGLLEAAQGSGARLVEIRDSEARFPVATGDKRKGKRLLSVGTDCALGKKYTALAITREMQRRGTDCTFRATGQTGIMIAGAGIAIDAIVSDFVAGAAEALSPEATANHWDIIEGQGSLLHPGYAAVTLGLLHGSQPDELVLCHDPRRMYNLDSPHIKIPPLSEVIDLYLSLGRLTNPAIQCRAISLNTRGMREDHRTEAFEKIAEETGLIVFDPVATGVDELVDALGAL
ncbi:MAG: putative NAD-dependent epimerase/dehydratase family protein [Halioglobus sp.]|jgi:uncharacterized NAD-dependent epimerase/dehydratase family protein